MPSPVPATHLIADGECSAACLLAADSSGPCECPCRGRHHAALNGATVDLDARPAGRPALRPLLPDVLTVLGGDDWAHSVDLLDRLNQRWSDSYSGWTVDHLARRLAVAGVRTKQICRPLAGRRTNRRGVLRTEVLSALGYPT